MGDYFSAWYLSQKFDSAKIHRAFIAWSHAAFIPRSHAAFIAVACSPFFTQPLLLVP